MTLLDFARAQRTPLPIALTPSDCHGRTYIVTGANIGLGFEATKHLARLGAARVIIAVRNLTSGEAAKQAIQAATGCADDVLQVWHVDLSSYESVAEFAARAGRELDRIDAVIENAALAQSKWIDAEGNESSLTVNVFSTVLMALLLVPHLQRTAEKHNVVPRIAIVGSNAGFAALPLLSKLNQDDIFGDLQNKEKWAPDGLVTSYGLTKLLLLLSFLELTRRLPLSKTNVVIDLVNPGLCYSSLDRNSTWAFWFRLAILRLLFARSTEVGSRTLLHGIAAGEEAHGHYLSECADGNATVPALITSEEGRKWQAAVWREVTATLEKAQPGSLAVLST